MRSVVLVAACLSCAGYARRMRTAENGDVEQLRKLATLLLASNSFFGSKPPSAGSQEIDNTWALGDEKGRAFADPIPGTHSQAEVEFWLKQQKMAEGQTQEQYGHTWGLGDEKGRQWAGPKAGTHSQAEVEFKQKQSGWRKFAGQGGVFAGRGGAAEKPEKNADIDNAWALGYENGRTYDGPIAGTHSQAEVEFLEKEEKMAANEPQSYDNNWGLGDEKGRQWAGQIAGTHSQAEVEFEQKQEKMAENEPQSYGHTWGLGDEKGRQWAGQIGGTHSQAEVEFEQKQNKWHKR